MKNNLRQKSLALAVIGVFGLFGSAAFFVGGGFDGRTAAQENDGKEMPSPTPGFDQDAALAKLREQIKGRESEPAEKVFMNIKSFEGVPAGRLLAIMQFGYARSLGVDCTHCHVPEKWELETKPTKQIARDMKDMAAKINSELLGNMKSLGERQAIINCTTCHRGEIKPALNLPMPEPKPEPKPKSETKSG